MYIYINEMVDHYVYVLEIFKVLCDVFGHLKVCEIFVLKLVPL